MNNSNVILGIVAGVVAVVVAALAAASAVLIFGHEGTDIAPLIGLVGTSVASLAGLAGVLKLLNDIQPMKDDIAETKQQTTDLTNGLMDSKIRAGVADVIPDHLLDSTYARHQLAADRVRAKRAAQRALMQSDRPDLT